MISKACAALLRGASRGDADAMARLAHRYSHGDGVPKDLEQALNWALASADAGNPRGAYLAGLMLAQRNNPGDGSFEQAQVLLRQAADAGYGRASEVLALMRSGMAVDDAGEAVSGEDAEEAEEADPAVKIARLEAESRAGDPCALYDLGCAFMDGEGVAKDPERGASLIGEAAAKGHDLARLVLAEAHLKREFPSADPARGAKMLAEVAMCRDADVLVLTSLLYDTGVDGFPPDAKQALACLRRAADLGHVVGQYETAVRLSAGDALPKNLSKAVGYARKAAEQGCTEAQRLLGDMYRDGKGVASSLKTAFHWYTKAADAGDEEALLQQALMLSEGRGCRQNRAEACEILEGLAVGGLEGAELTLAGVLADSSDSAQAARGMAKLRRMAEEGACEAQSALAGRLLSASRDAGPQAEELRTEARMWLEKAAAQGDEAAAGLLAELFGAEPRDGARRRRRRPGLARLGLAARRKKQ